MSEPQATTLPPGTVGVLCDVLARYSMFSASMTTTWMPPGCRVAWAVGSSILDNMNNLVEQAMGDWLWIMGDDHAWGPNLLRTMLTRMYSRDLDILVPLCVKRGWPWDIVAYTHQDEEGGFVSIDPAEQRDDPLVEVVGAGTAGMLVRKRVFEAMENPWFTRGEFEGKHSSTQLGEDVWFCFKAREAGFKVWADTSLALGHMNSHVAWPAESMDDPGTWGLSLNFGGENSIFVPRSNIVVPVEEPGEPGD